MCNALNGIAIVLCFLGISIVTGYRHAVWQVIITLAIIYIDLVYALIISPPWKRDATDDAFCCWPGW
ncbi:Uncharacterised protein [Klebsiella quasipneumoniae]|nr:Uncharacterised protein [Klebsiella quasipneumoniae]